MVPSILITTQTAAASYISNHTQWFGSITHCGASVQVPKLCSQLLLPLLLCWSEGFQSSQLAPKGWQLGCRLPESEACREGP
jgi:hypothetical protein